MSTIKASKSPPAALLSIPSKRSLSSNTSLSCPTPSMPDKKPRNQGPVVFWFRKDLRLSDNTGLHHARVQASDRGATSQSHKSEDGALLSIFVVCGRQWHVHDWSAAKVDLMLRSVRKLQSTLESKLNIPLVILHARSIKQVPNVVHDFCVENNATHLFYNKEYEVNEQTRDVTVTDRLIQSNIQCVAYDDECVVPPGLVTTKDGSRCPVVYTPFRKAWELLVEAKNPVDFLAMSPLPEPNSVTTKKSANHLFGTVVPCPTDSKDFELPGFERVFDADVLAHTRQNFPEGEQAAQDRLNQFAASKIKAYSVDRDFPALDGTANLSAYLGLGLVSARQCINIARAANDGILGSGNKGCVHWIQEIVWREFYRHILFAFPQVCKRQPFKLNTLDVPWAEGPEAERHFAAWCEGRTGYPIVDAGMRQLLTTGIMSNRLRMITAMFLTKDLLIDWRRGEKFFMNHLIDGDFASNNGGWQWAASTGTDSQPYFRIFNPYLQSVKFDANGDYIKRHVPELSTVPSNAVHEPNVKLTAAKFLRLGYPMPLVDHKKAREKVLAAFKVPEDQAY